MLKKIILKFYYAEEQKRYVIFPIKHEPFWNMYKKAKQTFGLLKN